jgi:mannan endo-1,4-beta-mannosidase
MSLQCTHAQSISLDAKHASISGDISITTYKNVECVQLKNDGSIVFDVEIPETGFYNLIIRVSTPFGNKNQDLWVNDEHSGILIFHAEDNWFDYNAGTIMLETGNNSIEIRSSWGWMYFSGITLTIAPENDYSLSDKNLINPNSNEATKEVYAFLRSNYGKNIISGQTSYWDELIDIAGKTPLIRAFDFQSYTIGYPYLWDNSIGGHSFGWHDNGNTQSAIDWHKSTEGKGIVSFQWHWHSPWGGQVSSNTFYTQHTSFDVSKAVTPGTDEYTAIIADIDSIASQLKHLQNENIPVLWRPLHEAGGQWFWWGAKTAKDCLALYDILYNRLTNHHQLNNLIWVWSTPEEDWYPGNDKVDIIGFDSYPGEYVYGSQKAVFNKLYSMVEGRKMIAMTENGPIPDIDKCIEEDAMWLYFSAWADLVAQQNTNEHIRKVYAHKKVITIENRNDTVSSVIFSNKPGITVYPNPATNVLNIDLSGIPNIQGKIKMFNAEGKKVKTIDIKNDTIVSLDISNLPQGIYILHHKKLSDTIKIVKQ